MRPDLTKQIVITIVLAAAYFFSGRLGLLIPAWGSNITLLWFPTGIAVAVLYRWGYLHWPGVLIGAFAVPMSLGNHWSTSSVIAIGNTVGPLLTVWLLRRWRFDARFERHWDILILSTAAALGMLIPASNGVLALTLSDTIRESQTMAWLLWWGGDTMGVISIAPLILTCSQAKLTKILGRNSEFVIWLLSCAATTVIVFVINTRQEQPGLALAYIPLPHLAWAALRFGSIGTSFAIIMISTFAAFGTANGNGPFAVHPPEISALILWAYMVTCTVLGWLINSVHSSRLQAMEMQRLLENALNEVSLGVLLAGLDRKITFSNDGFTRLSGYSPADIIGKSCSILQGPDTDPGTIEKLKEAFRGDGFFEGDILNYRKSGEPFWNALLISPVRNERGEKTGFLGVQRDVTERHQAELALFQSREHLRSIIELEPECVSIMSSEGIIQQMNPAGLAMLEAASFEDVQGINFAERVVSDEREGFESTMQNVLQGKSARYEFWIRSFQGIKRRVEMHAVPYRDELGKIIGVLGITRDITEQQVAQAQLKASEERLRLALFAANQGLYDIDLLNGNFVVSPEYASVFGYAAADFHENMQSLATRIHPKDRDAVEKAFRECLSGREKEFRVEFQSQATDGIWRWILSLGRIVEYTADGRPQRMLGIVSDISAQKQLEIETLASRERFQAIVERSYDLTLIIDAQGVIRFVNASALSVLGYTPDEMIGQNNLEFIHPQWQEYAKQNLSEMKNKLGKVEHVEILIRHKNGGWRTLEATATHLPHVASIEGTVINCRDVTERKLAEKQNAGERTVLEMLAVGASLQDVLTRIAKNYMDLHDELLCSILLLDHDSQTLRHGASAGLPNEYCKAIDGIQIGPNVGCFGTAAFTRKLVASSDIATDPLWIEYRELALAHGLRSCWSVPLISSADRVLGVIAVYHKEPHVAGANEIAELERGAYFARIAIERYELSYSLRESQVRLETLVGNLPGMAYRCQVDQQWTMTYVNDGCEAITGYRRDELENNRTIAYGDLVHPDDRDWLWEKCSASLATRTPCFNEYRIIDRNGNIRWVCERASGVYDAAGNVICVDGFIQDITEQRRAKLEREEFDRRMLETQKLESLGVLAGGIAHDFNNILTTILGNAYLIGMNIPASSKAQEYLAYVNQAAMRAAGLCKQMLAYSGRGRLLVQHYDIGKLIRETADLLKVSISKKVELRIDLAKRLPAIEMDVTQIQQVIMNLVINASEALEENAGVVELNAYPVDLTVEDIERLRLESSIGPGLYVVVRVKDTGCGMSENMKAKIFDPFFTTKFAGRGLGLAAVLGIVRGHRGAIQVESHLGQGTTFMLYFPGETKPVTPEEDTNETSAKSLNEGAILIVDDEEQIRQSMAALVNSLGFEAVVAPSGVSAIDVFRADPNKFVAVLLDLTMPGVDGEETFDELRKIREDIPVVLMSGFSQMESLGRFTGKGLAGFLEKPFPLVELRKVLLSAIHKLD
jgi:PAS domain S-box-containing protein